MFNLPELKYNYDALEPFIDAKTMEIHHSKHHQAYVDNLNAAWSEFEKVAPSFTEMSLEDILRGENLGRLRDLLLRSSGECSLVQKLQDHGGGHLNHSLFWQILKPASDGENTPPADFLEIIEKQFFSFEDFKASFKQAALGRFGSGWAWLRVNARGELVINSTPNQEYWSLDEFEPILGLDVWEHAYYLGYQNRRADYIDAFWSVVDWGVVFENYKKVALKNGSRQISLIEEGDFEEGACDIAECEKSDNPFENGEKRVIYTDGSASPNPGPGGFAVIENGAPIFLGGEENSTNIRMEGLALKSALEIVGDGEAEIWTDSEFWINVLTKWAPSWKKSGWKKKSGEIKNLDIVKPLFELFEGSNVEIKWLKGHAGHEFNEMADEWANRAREGERV